MPHARRGPLPSPAAHPGGGPARPLDRLSRRRAHDGRGACPGRRGGRHDGERVGSGGHRRLRSGRGARRADLPAGMGAGVVAPATLRPAPPESPRLVRRSRQVRAPRGRARARGGRGRLRAPAHDPALVALGGGRVLRRQRGARLRLPGVDRPALLPPHAARRRGALRAAPRPRAPYRRAGGLSVDRRPVPEEPHCQRRGRRARPHAAHRPLRHAHRALNARRDRVRAGPRAGSSRPRRRASRPRRPRRADARELLGGGRAGARRRARVRAGGRRRTLRTLVEAKAGLLVPGAYDGVSAKLVQQAGFPAVYMTGYGTSASRLGLPDLGFAGLAEMADHARSLVAVLDVPLIADADTGYGNALNVRRTVQVYEAAGVAALHIEDQVTPKRCGHLSGHQVIPRAAFTGKVRAAVEARTDPDLLIIARTDAISAVDVDEALRRGEAAAKAGADVLFIEAPRDEAQVERVARAFDTPLLYNYAPGGRSPLLPFPPLPELGFAVVLLPVDTLLVAVQAIRDFLAAVKARDDVLSLKDRYMPFRDFNELIGVTAQLALAERYTDDARSAT